MMKFEIKLYHVTFGHSIQYSVSNKLIILEGDTTTMQTLQARVSNICFLGYNYCHQGLFPLSSYLGLHPPHHGMIIPM